MTDEATARVSVRRLFVTTLSDGWEVREEQDSTVVSIVYRHDWHRVERDCLLFDLRVRRLETPESAATQVRVG